MTMRELAKLANVSVATVSKAFSGAEDISEETKERVFNTARQYGCFGKFYKGKYQKKIIAVIFPELKSNYYTNYVEQLKRLIEDSGCIPVLAADDFSQEKQAELVEYFCSYLQVDGVIVFRLKNKLKKGYTTPIISLFSSDDNAVDSVNINTESAIYAAVKLLMEMGHTQIAYLGEPLTRYKGRLFREAMTAMSPAEPVIIESEHRFEDAGQDGVRQLMAERIPFTALLCAYDNIAFGAIKQLQRAGLRVPEDVSVIGFDNIATGEYAQTTLTTIDTSPREVCMVTWDLMQKKLKNPYFHSRQTIAIETTLILRDSVAPVKEENHHGKIFGAEQA